MVVGVFVRQGQEAPNSAGDRVFGHRGIGELAELVEAGLVVLQPQPPRDQEVVGDVVAEHLQRPVHAGRHLGGGLGGGGGWRW